MSTEFNVTMLAKGLWSIDEGMVRCFLVEGSERALLLDSCMSDGAALVETVKGLTDKQVSLVFTHTDPDHTGGQDFFGTPMLHPAEYDYYSSRGNDENAVDPLWEGAVLDLGDTALEVVLIPGHTPGSIALLDRANRRLFVGDTVSVAGIFLFGPGRNLRAFIESLKRLEGMADAYDVVYPCHASAELGSEWVEKTRIAAEKLLAGELVGEDPPMDLPCKAYSFDGTTILY